MAFVLTLMLGSRSSFPPMLYGRGGAAELDLHPAFHEIRDKSLVRVASRYHSVRIVRFIVQRHVSSCSVTWPALVWNTTMTRALAFQSAMFLVMS